MFLLCAEGLSALLRKAERDSLIRGISICRRGPRISHLFFADDSIIFCRANSNECVALHGVLALYANASGQVVNNDKTALFFSCNTPQSTRDSICSIFGTIPTNQFEKYLGLPPVVGEQKGRLSMKLRIELGGDCKGGRRSCYHKQVEKFLLKRLSKLYQHTQ
jgi:hypothetical protein